MNEILSNLKLIKSKRQPNNLNRLLTKAKLNHNVDHEVKRCNRHNCGLCIHLLEGNSIEINCRRKFYVHESMTCEVKNDVYVIKCRGCNEEYIGETGNCLRRQPGRVAQSVGHLTRKSGVLGSIPGLATYFRFSFRFFKKGSCPLLAKVCARSTG